MFAITHALKTLGHSLAKGDLDQESSSLSDNAWKNAPRHFFLLLATQFFTKLGDALVSTKVVLPWILASIGASPALIGLLVPIRESGSLIPQAIIGEIVKKRQQRKPFFIAGCVIQGVAILGMALAILFIQPNAAAFGVIFFLIVFSLARGFCSVSSKDIIGKCIPKKRRGRLNGLSASAAGIISIVVGLSLFFSLIDKGMPLAGLLLAGSACFVMAAWIVSAVVGYAHKTENGDQSLSFKRVFKGFGILKSDSVFRRFVIVRCLLISSGLAIPYLVMLAKNNVDTESSAGLGLLILTGGIASFVAGPLWGRFADTSSRKLMITSAVVISVLSMSAGVSAYFLDRFALLIFIFLFFMFSLVHEGVRLARKTYVLDIAEGNKRTSYVSVSNSVIGLMLLVVGLISSVLAQYSIYLVLSFFSLTSMLAAVLAIKLPES